MRCKERLEIHLLGHFGTPRKVRSFCNKDKLNYPIFSVFGFSLLIAVSSRIENRAHTPTWVGERDIEMRAREVD